MKKSKYILLGFLICFIVTFIIGTVLNFIDLNNKIYVKPIENFNDKINSINEQIDKVKDENCKESLKTLSNRVKETYYESNVSIKKYFDIYYTNQEYVYNDFYTLYLNTKNTCQIDNNEIDNYAFASKSFPETVKTRINTNHILDFKDYFNYKTTYEVSDNIGTFTNKTLELKVVKELANEVYKKENINKK